MSLYLVDGHALAYRAHYAFASSPLTNSKGEETSAVYGFVNSILTLIDRHQPTHIVVAFDAAGKNFRHDMFDAYKANRKAMPDSLQAQLPVIHAVLDAMGIRHCTVPGYEADDIIATMAQRWCDRTPIEIVSGDKDLFQLIDERIRVIRPGKGNVLENEFDAVELVKKVGLRPDQFVDYLALMGDSSDNVPGVKGIGEKTARKLLSEWDTLDNIFEHIESVKPLSVRTKLERGREEAFLSRKLVRLCNDVPLDVELDELSRGDHRTAEFQEMLAELGFDRMARQLFDGPTTPTAPAPDLTPRKSERRSGGVETADQRYMTIGAEAELASLCAELATCDEFAIDVETSGLDPMRAVLAGVSMATAPGRAWYVPVSSTLEDDVPSLLPGTRAPGLELDTVQRHLAPLLAAERPAKIGQNIKFDAIVLECAGMPVAGIRFDTMIASYCLDPARRSHGLDALALDLCGHEMVPFSSLFEKRTAKKDIRTLPLERVGPYACEDADYTLRLKEIFAPMIEASQVKSLFEDVEMPLRDVLMRMEMTGVRIDLGFLAEMSRRYGDRIVVIESQIYDIVGETFNINSTVKLREILFDRLGLSPKRKTKTGFSTDVDVLTQLADKHAVVPLLLEYRHLVKLKSTYIDALPRLVNPGTGRVHTSYNQAVASTGRLSSSDPNLQNIPIRTPEGREVRRAFMPRREGWLLLDADYSQIELRILAHLSGDRGLVRAFRDDDDIHRLTAAKILGVKPEDVSDEMRSRAKTVNFGIVYGMGARGLAQSLDIDVQEAAQFIDEYFQSYPGVKRFIDDTIMRAREDKAIGTMLGRIRRLPDIDSSDRRARAFSERVAVNTPVQGTAADIIKLAMLEADRRITEKGLESRMILQVHDELLFDVPEEELEEMKHLVRESMETAVVLDVPLKVDMKAGKSWYDAH